MIKPKTLFLFLVLLIESFTIQKSRTTENLTLTTSDGIKIAATLALPSKISGKIPVVILIHQGGSDKAEWINSPFFSQLLDAGYAVLAYDVRNHGNSENDGGDLMDLFNNPNRAPLDLQAVIAYLQKIPIIDAQRIAIVGSSIGGNLACVASANPDVYPIKTAVAISCKTQAVINLAGTKNLKMKSVFLISSKNDQNGQRAVWAEELYQLSSPPHRIAIAQESGSHGVQVLADDPELYKQMVDWLNETL